MSATSPEPASGSSPNGSNRSRSGERWRNRLLAAMLTIIVLYATALAKAVVIPVLLAVLFSLLLAPMVRRLCHWRLPRVLGAFLVLATVLTAFGLGIGLVAGPARQALVSVPAGADRIEQLVRQWRRPIERMSRSASQSYQRLVDLTEMGESGGNRTEIGEPPIVERVVSSLPVLAASLVVVVFLTFLLLLHGDALLRKSASLLRSFEDRRRLVQTTRNAQQQLSTYVLTITLVNTGLGLTMAGALALLGVDNALAWGGLAAVLNFAPYVGPMIGLILLSLAALAQFADPAMAMLPPLVYLGIQTLEGQLVTPMVLGRSMSLDPVIVFLSMLMLGWLWGVMGILLAVPLLTCLRICAEQVPHWFPLARLLGPDTPIDPRRVRRHSRPRAALVEEVSAIAAITPETPPEQHAR